MSTTVDFTTVTNSIAALSITGVTVKDVDEIPPSMNGAKATLVPNPDNFVTNLVIKPAEISKQNLDVEYILHYTYYHCPIGAEFKPTYNALITNLALIVKAFASDTLLTGAVDCGAPTISRIGPVNDLAGNRFFGCEVTIKINQFLEV